MSRPTAAGLRQRRGRSRVRANPARRRPANARRRSGAVAALGAFAVALLPLLLTGCSGGFLSLGGGDPGSGGGPNGPGPVGNPLAIELEFSVRNDTATSRTETIRASVPFPHGGYPDLANVVVSGHRTAWRILQRWPDDTVRVAQAQFTDVLPPHTVKTYRISRDVPAETGPFTRNDWVGQLGTALDFGAEVEDTFNVRYRAFARGAGELLQESPLVQVRRHRTYHLPVSGQGIGRDYLTSTFYVSEFRDVPVVLVDWILGNDYLGADVIPAGNTDPNLRPLGMIDVRRASFLARGPNLVRAYRAAANAVGGETQTGDGYRSFQVMQDTYLEDGQTRRYRFVLYVEHPAAGQPDRDRWRTTFQAMADRPLFPLATQRTWQETDGAGLLGGPIPGPADAFARAEAEYQTWLGANHFGTFGSSGDPVKTGTTGTPRNHPLSPELAHAIQAGHHNLLQVLEGKAWAQAMRPYHLFGLQVGAEQDILLWDGIPIYPGSRDLSRESLGRRALWAFDPYPQYRTMTQTGGQRAHGWEHFDHEHWTTDLLFDHWTVSGDAWAHEELRQLGESLKGLMRLRRYSTSGMQAVRAEGWTMQGFVQVYLATGDERIAEYARRRLNEVVIPQQAPHASHALGFQGNYPGTRFPSPHEFFMPWQHGALLYGYLGAYRHLEDPEFLRVSDDVVSAVEYSWVTNYQDPHFGFVANGLRYYTPTKFNGSAIPPNFWDSDPAIGVRWSDSPLGGANVFLIAGLHILADWSSSSAVRQRAITYGTRMFGAIDDNGRWNKWYYCIPAHRIQ